MSERTTLKVKYGRGRWQNPLEQQTSKTNQLSGKFTLAWSLTTNPRGLCGNVSKQEPWQPEPWVSESATGSLTTKPLVASNTFTDLARMYKQLWAGSKHFTDLARMYKQLWVAASQQLHNWLDHKVHTLLTWQDLIQRVTAFRLPTLCFLSLGMV